MADVQRGLTRPSLHSKYFHEATIEQIDELYNNALSASNQIGGSADLSGAGQVPFYGAGPSMNVPAGKSLNSSPDIRTVLANAAQRAREDAEVAEWLLACINTTYRADQPLPPSVHRVVSGLLNYLVNSRY